MRITTLSAISLALLSAGATSAFAGDYYNPSNGASNTGFTTGYELFRTIGCPGKQLLDRPCSAPPPIQVINPTFTPVPVVKPTFTPPAAPAPMDSDHDGVTDDKDKCPNTPAGDKVDENGCSIKKTIILHGVNFNTDSAKLRPESYSVLDQAASALKMNNCPATEVAGYTDSTASAAYNKKLSQRRANTVKDYLVNKGCPASAFTSMGFGEESPIADNKTKAGRAENRRVELHVTQTVYEKK